MCVLTKYYEMIPISGNETLLVNMLTSALDIIDDETKNKIESMKDTISREMMEQEKELCKQLRTRGYIFKDREEEKERVKKLFEIHKAMNQWNFKKSFVICPTMSCNLRCTYCFESEEQHRDTVLMTKEQLQQVLGYIKEKLDENKEMLMQLGKQDMRIERSEIKLFGGEPLLKQNFHLIKRVLEFAKNNDIAVKIITNGTMVDYYMELLKKYEEIISIQITVDGSKKIHDQRRIRADGNGTYDLICSSIDKLLKENIEVTMRINVDKENIEFLGELEKNIKDMGWNQSEKFIPYASPVQCFDNSDSNVMKESEFLEKLVEAGYYGGENSFLKGIVASCVGYLNVFFSKKVKVKPWKIDYCEATSGNNICFAPDGSITTCLTYVGKGRFNVGTFDSEGVYINEKVFKMWEERNIRRIDKCRECKYAFICGGGCPVAALETNHNIDHVVCSDIKNTLKVYVQLMKEKILGQ